MRQQLMIFSRLTHKQDKMKLENYGLFKVDEYS